MNEVIENPEKANEKWGCFGHYMEMNKPWTDAGVCSDKCHMRYPCWRNRNGIKKKENSGSQK